MLWLDGKLHTTAPGPFDLRDRGLTLADGVFDTMLVLAGRPVFPDYHLDRLMRACETLRIEVERATVAAAMRDLAAAGEGDAIIRVTVTRGAGARGLRIVPGMSPTVLGVRSPWQPDMAFQPVRLATSAIRRNATSPLSRIKSLAYLDNVLALDEALAAGADDALILSTEGNVACTSAGNVFVLRRGDLLTPPVSDGVLDGTVRDLLLRHATRVGLQPSERALSPDDLLGADAVFATNSARLISPATMIDGTRLPDAERIIAPLCKLVAEEVGLGIVGG